MACTCKSSDYSDKLFNRKAWLDKFMSKMLKGATPAYNALTANRKQKLFERLNSKSVHSVLEMGAGTGANFDFLPKRKDLHVIAVDPNPLMKQQLEETAREKGWDTAQLQFIHGVAEALPVPDASQDAVYCTLVLCSVTDPTTVLREVRRVLKPGGVFLFMEHVGAPPGSWRLLLQRLLSPLWVWAFDGCTPTRDTAKTLQAAGFSKLELERFQLTSRPDSPLMFKLIFGMVVKPHICGVAIK